MSQEPVTYDARHIQVLEGWEAVRKRPGMYIGSTRERGLHQLVVEVASRAVNEVLAARATRVEVTLMPDGGVRVADAVGSNTSPATWSRWDLPISAQRSKASATVGREPSSGPVGSLGFQRRLRRLIKGCCGDSVASERLNRSDTQPHAQALRRGAVRI